MMSCGSEARFLCELFRSFNNAGIRYAVMRNYETLPYSAGGSDLDVLIASNQAAQAREAVFLALRAVDGVPIGLTETFGTLLVSVLGKTLKTHCSWWGVLLDFNFGLHFRGLLLLDERVTLPLEYYRGIPVLANGFAGVLGVLKEALNNGKFSLPYSVIGRTAAINEWGQVEALLAPIGNSALARLRTILLSDASPDKLNGECCKLRQDVVRQSFRQHGGVSIWRRAAYELTRVRRYLKPSGVIVAILGVDGAGKTTMINAILPALNAATHNAVVVQHLHPTLLPPLARWKGKSSAPVGPVSEPHGSTTSGSLVSLFRLAYLTMDYLLGYWLWTRPKIAKQPTVVLFDRYAYDMALDPRRLRVGLSSRVAGLFAALAPKPDLIFCLHGSPEIIAGRKEELSVEETQRQVQALRAFAAREPRAVLISTECEVAQARDEILNSLLSFLEARQSLKR